MKKNNVLELMDYEGIQHSRNITAIEAKVLLKNCITENVKPEVVRIAQENGRDILFTPHFHSQLQPTEVLWAVLKEKYWTGILFEASFKEVEEKLKTEFF